MNKDELVIKINDVYLEQNSHNKFIGVWIDHKINLKYISQISNKISKIVGMVENWGEYFDSVVLYIGIS